MTTLSHVCVHTCRAESTLQLLGTSRCMSWLTTQTCAHCRCDPGKPKPAQHTRHLINNKRCTITDMYTVDIEASADTATGWRTRQTAPTPTPTPREPCSQSSRDTISIQAVLQTQSLPPDTHATDGASAVANGADESAFVTKSHGNS